MKNKEIIEEQKKEKNTKDGKKRFNFSPKQLYIALVIELIALIAINMVFVDYAKLAPKGPTQYADPKVVDEIKSGDGKLAVNNIEVTVPDDENTNYSIAYSWAKDDTDYPSVPQAAVASYEKKTKETADDTKAPAEDSSNNNLIYEISLYKDSYTKQSDIPNGKNADNWFSDWTEDESEGVVKKKLTEDEINGFLISSLNADSYSDDYRSYSFSFAVSESKGISVYILDGICYDPASRKSFESIMGAAIKSIKLDSKAA